MMTRMVFMGLFIIFHWYRWREASIDEARKAWGAWQAREKGRKDGS